MNLLKKIASFIAALFMVAVLAPGTAEARDLRITWAFLFPIPLPLPVWTVDHPHSFVTIGFLFPVWLPLPLYDYGDNGPIQPRFSELKVPSDSSVYIDGNESGKVSDYEYVSPLTGLTDGTHTLELRHGGKTLYAMRFDVSKGKVGNIEGSGAAEGQVE